MKNAEPSRKRGLKRFVPDPNHDQDGFPVGHWELFREDGTGAIDTVTIKGKQYVRGRLWIVNELGVKERKAVYAATREKVIRKLEELSEDPLKRRNNRATLKTYSEHFLATVKPTIALSTYNLWENTVRKHIVPHIGLVKLRALQPSHVDALLKKLKDEGVGARTIQEVRKVLVRMYRDAQREKVVDSNPASLSKAPRVPKNPPTLLTQEECVKLLAVTQETEFYSLFRLLIVTGMRIGEVLALTPSDLRLDGKEPHLWVRFDLEEDENGKLHRSDPKTDSSADRVDLDAETANELSRKSEGLKPDAFLFTLDKEPIAVSRFRKTLWKTMLKKAGCPYVRPHSVRHVANSIMLADGQASVLELARRLRHSSPRMTLDVYSQMVPGRQRQVADRAAALFTPKGLESGLTEDIEKA